MPFEQPAAAPKRIAVIGAGISGMGAAYHLADAHSVTLFEAEPRLGGHARTIVAGKRGDQPVDTGFIVFNYVNYPNLRETVRSAGRAHRQVGHEFCRLHRRAGASSMASAACPRFFAQKRNLANPGFLRMVRDLVTFKRAGRKRGQRQLGDAGRVDGRHGARSLVPRLLPDADLGRESGPRPKEEIMDFPRAGAGAVLPQPSPVAGDGPAPVVHGAGRLDRIRHAAGTRAGHQGAWISAWPRPSRR